VFFHGFWPGQRFTSGPRLVTAAELSHFLTHGRGDTWVEDHDPSDARGLDAGPILRGALGACVIAGLWAELGLVAGSFVASAGQNWTTHETIRAGDALSLTVTVVRIEDDESDSYGAITFYNELLNNAGVVVQSGTNTELVSMDNIRVRSIACDVGTPMWGQALAALLGESAEFQSAVSSWDGSIGLRGGAHEVHLRIYRGRIIDVTRRAPHGATFTFGASDHVWVDVLTAPDVRFGARLLTGDFEATGDMYEYLRLTKALEIIVEAARLLAADRQLASLHNGGDAG
jgi:hypothetical protein